MNLKYSSIFLFIATSLFGSSALAANTIQFTGKIVDSSCKVEVKDGTNNTVDLGVWPTSSFGSQGDKTTPIPFTLTISDCAEGSNGVKGYYMDFQVATDDNDSSLIKLNQEK